MDPTPAALDRAYYPPRAGVVIRNLGMEVTLRSPHALFSWPQLAFDSTGLGPGREGASRPLFLACPAQAPFRIFTAAHDGLYNKRDMGSPRRTRCGSFHRRWG